MMNGYDKVYVSHIDNSWIDFDMAPHMVWEGHGELTGVSSSIDKEKWGYMLGKFPFKTLFFNKGKYI